MTLHKEIIPLRSLFLLILSWPLIHGTGCGRQPENDPLGKSSAKAETPRAVPSPPVEVGPIPAGQPGRHGPFEITVLNVAPGEGYTRNPGRDQAYVVVAVQIKNVSGKRESVGAGCFGCVLDEGGNRGSHENMTGIKTDPPTFGAGNISPGDSFQGSLIFALPAGKRKTELHYTEGYTLKPDLRFAISW